MFIFLLLAQVFTSGYAVGYQVQVDRKGSLIREERSTSATQPGNASDAAPAKAPPSETSSAKDQKSSQAAVVVQPDKKPSSSEGHIAEQPSPPKGSAADAPVDFKVLSAAVQGHPSETGLPKAPPSETSSAKDQKGSQAAVVVQPDKKPSSSEGHIAEQPSPPKGSAADAPVDFKVLSSDAPSHLNRVRISDAQDHSDDRKLALIQTYKDAQRMLQGLKVDSYVINLEKRKDRCRCMEKQLAFAPQAVYRQPAVSHLDCDLPKDAPTLYGSRNHTNEHSLFCSNFKVWERAHQSDADFVVILEDDAILEPTFWHQVANLLKNCSSFDYMSVDSWKGVKSSEERDRVHNFCPTSPQSEQLMRNLFRPRPEQPIWRKDYWGTHVQIIRKTFLETMMDRAKSHGSGPLDVWWMHRLNDGKSFSWQPHISTQLARLSRTSSAASDLKEWCPPEASVSDIALVEMNDFDTSQPRLQC